MIVECIGCKAVVDTNKLPLRCSCGATTQIEKPFSITSVGARTGVGVGTELTKLIPKLFSSTSCNCKSYATKLNKWGVAICEQRFDEIVAYLVSQANQHPIAKHFGSVNEHQAKKWVTQAIETAKNQCHVKLDNDWMVCITTAPRTECTLQTCIDSIRQAGWEPVVFAEPDSTQSTARTITNEQRLGVWHNWLASARWAVENTSATKIMTVQDDSLFHPDSKAFVDSMKWPREDVGFVSMYTPKHYTIRRDKTIRNPGVNRIVTRSLWGACALVWPREVIEQVIDHPIAKNWSGARPKSGSRSVIEKRKANPERIANSDTAIGKIMNSMKRSMWFVDPSPVQHIARFSTIKHGDNTGRRNAWRIADHNIPLADQVPLPKNTYELKL